MFPREVIVHTETVWASNTNMFNGFSYINDPLKWIDFD